jgi:hypothetical protein
LSITLFDNQIASKPMAQVVEKMVGYPKFVSSMLWCCSFDRESFNAWRNNTRYLPTIATIITIWKTRIANLYLRSWQNPSRKYALLRGNRVRAILEGGGPGTCSSVWQEEDPRKSRIMLA